MDIRVMYRCFKLLRCVLVVGAAFGMQTLLPAQTNAPARTALTFGVDKQGALTVSTDHQAPQSLAGFNAHANSSEAKGLNLAMLSDGRSIQITSASREAVVEFSGFSGMAMRVPLGDQVRCAPDFKRLLIDFETAAANSTNAVLFRFSDGGKAAVSAGSSARFDLFKDESYYFSGHGRVEAVNADGRSLVVNPLRGPLTGGPLVKVKDKAGIEHMQRLSPIKHVRILGEMMDTLDVQLDVEQTKLKQDETRSMTLANGSKVMLKLDPKYHTLNWSVEKGYFMFHVVGIGCFTAAGLTDQAANQQWDTSSKSVDLSNRSPTNTVPANQVILSTMSVSAFAGVYPQSLFQYAQLTDCDNFAASGTGNRVTLYSSATGQSFDLAQGNVLFQAGQIVGGAATSKPTLSLSWQPGSALDLRGPMGIKVVKPDTEVNFDVQEVGQFGVKYGSGGAITVTANAGSYSVTVQPINGWSFDVPEGSSVRFDYDPSKGTFTVRADAGNAGSISANSGEGFLPQLTPDSTLTFVVGNATSSLAGSQGTIIFYEAAGGGSAYAFGKGPAPVSLPTGLTAGIPTSPTGDLIDSSRILQPSVSGFNGQ